MESLGALGVTLVALGAAGCAPWYAAHGLTEETLKDRRSAPNFAYLVAHDHPDAGAAALALADSCYAPSVLGVLPRMVTVLGQSAVCWDDRPTDVQLNPRCEALSRCVATLGVEGAGRLLPVAASAAAPNPSVGIRSRWLAILLLAELGPAAKDAVPVLVQALGDEEGVIRRVAARALAATGTRWNEALVALERASREDHQKAVRDAASQALDALKAPHVGVVDDADEIDDGELMRSLARLRQEQAEQQVADLEKAQRDAARLLPIGPVVGTLGGGLIASGFAALRAVGPTRSCYIGPCFPDNLGLAFVGAIGIGAGIAASVAGLVVTAIASVEHTTKSRRLRRLQAVTPVLSPTHVGLLLSVKF